MEPKSLADLIAQAKRTADKKRYTELMAEIEDLKIDHELAENAKRLEEEAKTKAEFEEAKAKHLAEIEDLEIKKRFLANNENAMIENMITGATMTKLQVETYAEAIKLAKHINRDIEKFGTQKQEVEPIEMYGTDLQWKNIAHGLLDRVAELLHWNEREKDHRLPVTPENVKIHPFKWGSVKAPKIDDTPEVDQAFFDSEELNYD